MLWFACLFIATCSTSSTRSKPDFFFSLLVLHSWIRAYFNIFCNYYILCCKSHFSINMPHSKVTIVIKHFAKWFHIWLAYWNPSMDTGCPKYQYFANKVGIRRIVWSAISFNKNSYNNLNTPQILMIRKIYSDKV